MDLKEFSQEIADKLKADPKAVESIIHAFFDEIVSSVAHNQKVSVPHLGIFRRVLRKGYVGRNPKTGESIDIPSKQKIHFKPAKSLKEFVNIKINKLRDEACKKYEVQKEKEKVIPFEPPRTVQPSPVKNAPPPPLRDTYLSDLEHLEERLQNHKPESPAGISSYKERDVKDMIQFTVRTVQNRMLWTFGSILLVLLFFITGIFVVLNSSMQKKLSAAYEQKEDVYEDKMVELFREIRIDLEHSRDDMRREMTDLQDESRDRIQREITEHMKKEIKSRPASSKTPIIRIIKYKVRKGDNLWEISRRISHNPYNWVGIFETNGEKINDPDLIYPGQQILIPVIITDY